MNKFIIRQSCLLFLTAIIWGVAFVAQSAGMDYVQPFTFSATRSILGGIVLLPVIAFTGRSGRRGAASVTEAGMEDEARLVENVGKTQRTQKEQRKDLLTGGLLCGLLLFIASNFQQVGIQYTTAGKAGFVTALYIVIVPIYGIFLHKKIRINVWLGVLFGLFGLYLLCMQEGFYLEKGDALVLVCALTFSLHIMVVDHFSPIVDGVKMSCIQFFVCGILSGIVMFATEQPQIPQILAAWLPIGYAGVLSCGVAYTLQIIGQKGMNPTIASLIMSLESVVSVLSGWLILHQSLQVREMIGCAVMFLAIILAQL